MAEVANGEVRLHAEVDGQGDPVSVLAHGLSNSCNELAMLTPFVPGTKVRFCFRGHGHSSSPESGYGFADFASDLDAVANEYAANVAIGTSLGAGAIMNLVAREPRRFDKLVFLLPAGLDVPFRYKDRMLASAAAMEGRTPEEAMRIIMSDPERVASYVRVPLVREYDEMMLRDLNTVGVPRAIREVIEDWPLRDRADMAKVESPTLLICRRGDVIHPAEVGEILADIMPNAELIMFDDGDAMWGSIPMLVTRVGEFLTE